MPKQSFFAELRKRKVVQAAAIYGAVAWGVTEILVTIVEQLFLPQWISTLAVIFFVVGFPVAMFLSWTFDLTSEGIQRTGVTSRRGTASIALSVALLVAGTAGLFFLIKPDLDSHRSSIDSGVITPSSVAVLPFEFTGPTSSDSHLGSGLSDELRDQLGRVSGLRIAARSSSIAVMQKSGDAKSMATSLGVANLLEGNMRRHGNILRVSVQLVDGASGLAIWSDTFDRGSRELLSVQQEIAEAVVRKVLPRSSHAVAEPATRDGTANELMLLARHYEQQALEQEDVDVETLHRAIQLYRDATVADPRSALAQSRLAGALMYAGDIDGAEEPAFRALALNPNLAEVQHTLGKFLFARGLPNMGEPLARAVELNPNLPDALATYAHWYWFNVSTDGVSDLYQRALDLDPLNVARYAALGSFLAMNDRPEEAREVVIRMTEVFDGAVAYRAIEKVLDILGDVDHAIAWTIKARNEEPDNPRHIERLAELYTDIGDYETALSLEPDIGAGMLFKMRRYAAMIDKAEIRMIDYPEDMQLRVYLAMAYNAVGNYEAAIRIISTSGLLNSFPNARRSTEEQDGLLALIDAAYASGEIEQAEELVERTMSLHYFGDTSDWWVALPIACFNAIVGQDNEVRRRFKRAQESRHLAWEPILKDSRCFERFSDDPVYQATVRHYDQLRTALRDRLPATLAQYGVNL